MKAALLLPPGVSDPDAAMGELVAAAQRLVDDVELVSLHSDGAAARALAAMAGVAHAATLANPLELGARVIFR